jgi:hypothetical protein
VSIDRSAIDKSISGVRNQERGKAHVTVYFDNVLKGVRAATTGEGALANIRQKKTLAVPTTGAYGTDEANQYAEE